MSSLVVLDVVLGGHGHDVRAAGQLADQHPSLVAHRFRIDVLVAVWRPGDGVTCMPPLWAKALLPTNGWLFREVHVGHLVDVAGEPGQVGHPAPASTS
jgi:hypothetical protein